VSTLFGMGVVQGLALAPITFIMTAIVFRQMDASLEEAAAVGGAGLVSRMFRVTLPLAWPGILAASIYVFTIGFTAFDVPAVLGYNYRIFTFSTYVFYQVNPTEAVPAYHNVAALSVIMIGLALVMSWWYGVMQRRAPRFAVVTGKAYRPHIVKLGRYKWVAIAFIAGYFIVSQLMPVLTLAWAAGLPFLQPISLDAIESLSLDNFSRVPSDLVHDGIRNTAALMVLTPTITLCVSFAFSWVVLRSKVPGRSLFDFAAFMPHAVPNIVFSMAALLLALFVLRDILPIYGTVWILVLVYVVSRIAYATRITNSALIQVHKELEEAAQMSGAKVGDIVRQVLVPLLKPAMIYAWIWMALLTYRELTLPVLLSSNDNLPLAVVVWNMWLSGQFGDASAVAILMLVVMMPLVAFGWVFIRRSSVATQGT
jgi:iron(III) transport system permease protein